MALGIVLSWACSRIEESPILEDSFEGVELTVRATMADAALTKTVIMPNNQIFWTKNDAINLFYGDRSSGKFVSTVEDEPQRLTDFVGTLTVATGTSEAGMGAKAFWGVYPYNENNTCDGTGVTMTLPSEQEGLAGSFADKLNPSVATAPGLDLAFYNVGAPFYFSVTQEGVTSATFRGNNDEDIAGKIHVTMDSNGRPVAEVREGEKSITLTAPDGGFVPGETYVLVLLPQAEMPNGYTVTFRKGNLEAECVVNKNVEFKRSQGREKKNADDGLTYTSNQPNNNEIWYTSVGDVVVNPYSQCDWVKMDQIESNTMTDGLGKIVFKNDITEVPRLAFYQSLYYGPLQTIILPNSVKQIGEKAFYGCSNLETIRIPEGLTDINDYAFYRCRKLSSILLPESLSSLGVNSFIDCDGLRTLTLNTSASFHSSGLAYLLNGFTIETIQGPYATIDGKYAIVDGAITMAAGYNVSDVIIPNGVTAIRPYVFNKNPFIKTVTIPESVNTIGSNAFYACTALDLITIESHIPPSGGGYSFNETNECPIIVPAESVNAYKEAWPQYSHRIGGSLEDVPTNLSKNGRANCYIVNSAGRYSFSAEKLGNSDFGIDEITGGTATSVDVLWESVISPNCTYNHESESLISNIVYENGQIIFTATGNEGNALVALKNSAGTIKWSWHLWFVNEEINEIASSLMDRNLGAVRSDCDFTVTSFANDYTLTHGLLYQKGRKDPFVGPDSDLWDYQITTTDFQTAVRNPTTLFGTSDGTWNTSPSSWYTTKGINDPCPPGWRVPSMSHFSGNWTFRYGNDHYPADQATRFYEVDEYYYQGHYIPCAGLLQLGQNCFIYSCFHSWSSDDDAGFQEYGYYYLTDGMIELRSGYNDNFGFSIIPFSGNNDYSKAFSIRCCRDN